MMVNKEAGELEMNMKLRKGASESPETRTKIISFGEYPQL